MWRSKRRVALWITILAFTGLAIWYLNQVLSGPISIPFTARRALQTADNFQLLSLDPKELWDQPGAGFHGFQILGETEISNAETRRALVDAFYAGVREENVTPAGCFNPRHG